MTKEQVSYFIVAILLLIIGAIGQNSFMLLVGAGLALYALYGNSQDKNRKS